MGIKFSSVVFLILAVFIVKISLENFGNVRASETTKVKSKSIELKHTKIKLSQK
jgi:hypothetical protein